MDAAPPLSLWCIAEPGAWTCAFVPAGRERHEVHGRGVRPRTPLLDTDALPFPLLLAVPEGAAPVRKRPLPGPYRVRFRLVGPDGEALLAAPVDPVAWAARLAEFVARVHELLEQLPLTLTAARPGEVGEVVLELDPQEGDATGICDALSLLWVGVRLIADARHVRAAEPVVFFRDGSTPLDANLYEGRVQ